MKTLLGAAWVAIAASGSLTAAFGPMRRDRGPLFVDSKVIRTLTNADFDVVLNDTQTVWLVDFYSPWCPHCRQFGPQYERVAGDYVEASNVQFGAVDCTRQKDVCNREDIFGYPAVKMYHAPPEAEEGIDMPHVGHIFARDVAKWIEEQLAENGIKSGVDVEQLYPLPTRRSDVEKFEFADPVEPTHDDQADDVKLKRVRDAATTVLFAFEDGFFTGTEVLWGERYDAALTWVDALAASFPMQANREALALLAGDLRQKKRWEHREWTDLLESWKTTANLMSYPRDLFVSSEKMAFCTTYTCGLWTLFHSMTSTDIKAVSPRGSLKPSEIMSAIRVFVKYFFGCEECRQHFLKANHDSVIKELAAGDDDGPHAVMFWIWKMHNTVNKRLKHALWPTQKSCPSCYVNNGKPMTLDAAQLNEREIVAYVSSVYKFEELQRGGVLSALWSSLGGLSSIVAIALLVALFATKFKKHTSRFTSLKSLTERDHIA